MKTATTYNRYKWSAAVALLMMPLTASAFESGSTGADGAFNPTVNTRLALPPGGVFNFTNVNIPADVTVTFEKNTTNTPVTWLVAGDVNIAGTVSVSGRWSTAVGAAGDGNIGDDGLPGEAGPGGFAGGRGGEIDPSFAGRGGSGLGPGGGQGGRYYSAYGVPSGGGGGGYGVAGARAAQLSSHATQAAGGGAYGSELLLPLIGGSGGGGGMGGSLFHGSGGGGGGGGLLIAASGTVTVSGRILAVGGNSGAAAGAGVGGTGGAGSGGAIRIVATAITGNGVIDARGGQSGAQTSQSGVSTSYMRGGNGGVGRVRLEAEVFNRTAATTPPFSFSQPTAVFVAGLPSLRIHSVAGVEVPEFPTGYADVTLPSDAPNPVTVAFATTGVPVGNTVRLTVTPAYGPSTTVVSPALTGSTDSATASVSVNIPDGPSTLTAQTTYTVIASVGDALAPFASGERVEQVRLATSSDGGSSITLITVSGKEYALPGRLPAMPAAPESDHS
ncbi:hypothetical protein HUS23_08110 [Ectothiorhodospiraceae bacterium 2226]|nr:hypothetical protein HUS23_08110 [Ectothiorhodospiraceae bacterium 2226]